MAYDRKLVGPVLGAFIKSVFASHRLRAKKRHAIARHVNLQPGAVTLIQRFGGAINLNVHFHTLVLDGIYAIDHKAGTIDFLPLHAPTHEEVLAVLTDTARRIARALQAHGLGDDRDADEADPLARRSYRSLELLRDEGMARARAVGIGAAPVSGGCSARAERRVHAPGNR